MLLHLLLPGLSNAQVDEGPFEKGIDALKLSNYSDAIKLLTKHLEGHPDDTKAFYYRSKAYTSTYLESKDATYLSKIMSDNDKVSQAAYRNLDFKKPAYRDSLVDWITGRYHGSIFDLVDLRENADAVGIVSYGDIAKGTGHTLDAIELYTRAIQHGWQSGDIYYSRALANANLRKYNLAILDFNASLKFGLILIHPRDVYFALGTVYHNGKSDNEAIDSYSKAMQNLDEESKPRLANEVRQFKSKCYLARGSSLSELGKFAEALSDYDKAVDSDSTNGLAYNYRGCLRLESKRPQQALSDFSKAIEISPRESDYYSNRGMTLNLLQQYDKAIIDLTKAIELDSSNASAYNNLAYVYIDKDFPNLASLNFQKALSLDHTDWEAMLGTALIHLASDQIDSVLTWLDTAQQAEPRLKGGIDGIAKLAIEGHIFSDKCTARLRRLFEITKR